MRRPSAVHRSLVPAGATRMRNGLAHCDAAASTARYLPARRDVVDAQMLACTRRKSIRDMGLDRTRVAGISTRPPPAGRRLVSRFDENEVVRATGLLLATERSAAVPTNQSSGRKHFTPARTSSRKTLLCRLGPPWSLHNLAFLVRYVRVDG